VDGGQAAGPGLRRLELGGQSQQRGLVAEAAEEVRADRQAVAIPPKRDCR
jgi:hypothetical protein